ARTAGDQPCPLERLEVPGERRPVQAELLCDPEQRSLAEQGERDEEAELGLSQAGRGDGLVVDAAQGARGPPELLGRALLLHPEELLAARKGCCLHAWVYMPLVSAAQADLEPAPGLSAWVDARPGPGRSGHRRCRSGRAGRTRGR